GTRREARSGVGFGVAVGVGRIVGVWLGLGLPAPRGLCEGKAAGPGVWLRFITGGFAAGVGVAVATGAGLGEGASVASALSRATSAARLARSAAAATRLRLSPLVWKYSAIRRFSIASRYDVL